MIRLYGKKLHDDLVKHGCVEKKSLILQFPKDLSQELISHFVRGYFDGDGCI
jgi:intein/homing endonuclease